MSGKQRVCGAVLAFVTALTMSSVTAETATPAAYPIVPAPQECIAAPVTVDAISSILATPVASSNASPQSFATPGDTPADPETAAAVVSVLHQVFACTNAGDFLRVYAFFTDDFVRDFFAGMPLTEDVAAFLSAPPRPLPADQQRIIRDVGPVWLFADGRAGVVIILDEPDDPRREEPDLVILEQTGGEWLVDEIHEDANLATPGAP